MSIDGLNSSQQVKRATTEHATPASPDGQPTKADAQVLPNALNGADRKSAQDLGAITPNERKELIKYYQECGYSKKEAEALFDSKATK
jgi:hypothetical protein